MKTSVLVNILPYIENVFRNINFIFLLKNLKGKLKGIVLLTFCSKSSYKLAYKNHLFMKNLLNPNKVLYI